MQRALCDAAQLQGASLSFPSGWRLQEVLELFEEAEARNRTDEGSDEDLAAWTRIDAPDVDVPSVDAAPRRDPQVRLAEQARWRGPMRELARRHKAGGGPRRDRFRTLSSSWPCFSTPR